MARVASSLILHVAKISSRRIIGWVKAKKLWIVIVASLVAIIAPLVAHQFFDKLEFNQFLIQRLKIRYLTATSKDLSDSILSVYSSGIDILARKHPQEPKFEDAKDMFDYVFSWVPPRAIIYPTEGFYYWNFIDKQGNPVSGNFRLANLDDGVVNFAYFVVDTDFKQTGHFTEKDGVIVKKVEDNIYDITDQAIGKTIRFSLPKRTYKYDFAVLPDEKVEGVIFDESGISFNLIYNQKQKLFYEFLREEDGVNDTLLPLSDRYLIGKRTGFVFYQDDEYNRKILVGVDLKNIAENNYLDGPGDQVPFWLTLKKDLNEAYPSTMIGAGIDDHGVILGRKEWARFVISPFYRYNSVEEIYKRNQRCSDFITKNVLWDCLTREWWNTPQWRADAIEKVRAENKKPPFTEY